MTERRTFDSFEQRIAAEFERYVEPADDPRPVSEIADTAMRPRRRGVRARNVARSRRILLIGLAAAFLVPAAYLGAMSLRAPAPDLNNQVQPPPSDEPHSTPVPSPSFAQEYVSIFVRRDDAPTPGLSIFAVRPDGSETLVRQVPDSVVPGGGKLWEWGTVSESGWLAIGSEKDPWPMILIDLRREDSTPWVVSEANTGGIGPRWGPTGLVAADSGGNGSSVVIADPDSHSTRIISIGGLIGGGPSDRLGRGRNRDRRLHRGHVPRQADRRRLISARRR